MQTNSERSRKWQRKQRQKGLCIQCRRKNIDGWRCRYHRKMEGLRSRNRYRKRHGIPLDAPLYLRIKPKKRKCESRSEFCSGQCVAEYGINGSEKKKETILLCIACAAMLKRCGYKLTQTMRI